MRLTFARVGALLGVVGLAAGALALGSGTARAFPVSIPLSPMPGSIATGGGSIFTDPQMSPPIVTITLAGAKPSTTFQVSACQSYNGFGACYNSGLTDQITTDASGGFNGTVTLPVAPTFDS